MRGVTTGREATWLGSWPGDTTRSTWPTSIRSAFSSWFQRLMSFQFWPVSRPMRISVSAITATTIATSLSRPNPAGFSDARRARRRRGSSMAATMAPAPIEASSSVKVPASPPSSPLATSGSRASKAVACKKKTAMRHNTARMRGDCRTN